VSFPSDTAATWSALQRLLETALALPDADRLIWLERSAEVPDALREPLRRLLEVQAGIDTRAFVATLPQAGVGVIPATPVLIGDMVGPYRLLQELGDGGMGSVWLAERADGALKRKVALKLPRLAWASDLAGRMARERDILGSLEHPNIARLYDAGVDQHGRPFLALEYVEGQRLDRYCDEQGLTVQGRIRLFLQVLDAVQYAHVNLVLHRDLKPANVLVNQRGEIRLLDFGIAKLMAEDSGSAAGEPRSESLSRAMTPRFASPEQVKHSRLTLASDIYSLGVVLYEILIGASPLITTHGSRAEFEIAIVDARLRTPSRAKVEAALALKRRSSPRRLSRLLRGDLDAVILKAMARKPEDRYVSAEAMRADLVRWLDGRPVEATPPSRLVALRKFIARNSLAVGFGTAAVTAIVTIAAIAVLQAREARLESERATATRDFVLSLFENANPELHGGRDVTARELLLLNSATAFSALDAQPEIHAEVLRAVADAWGRLGDYDRMIDVAKKRTRLLRGVNDISLYSRALLEEAQIEAGRGNLQRVKSIIFDIDSTENNYLTGGNRADLYWLKGWLSLSLEKYQEAHKYFNESLSASPRNDSGRFARAKFGLMKTGFGQSKRSEAIRMYRSALSDANDKSLSAGERLRRSFEIVAALYEIGEYRSGWPGISMVLRSFIKIYGEDAKFQSPIALYWANWAIKVGEIKQVETFITDYQGTIRAAGFPSRDSILFEWQLVEARMHLAKGDHKSLENLIKSIDTKSISTYQKMSIDILEAERFLMMKMPVDALRITSSELWISSVSANDPISSSWFVYRHWLEGVALNEIGEPRRAYEALSLAEAVSLKRFGESHPNTMKILLAKTYSSLRLRGDSGPSVDIDEQRLKTAVETLSLKFPINSKTVSDAVELSRIVSNGSGNYPLEVVSFLDQDVPFL